MNLLDLLRMSSSNLRRRKLRTFLTVLGVVIGTASIVVMISLGLGMQQSMYKEIEQSGGLTSLTVTDKESGNGGGMMMSSNRTDSKTKENKQYITDSVVKRLDEVEYVKLASPVLTVPSVIMKGNYEAYIELAGMSPKCFQELHIPIGAGKLPKQGGGELELLPGNQIVSSFMNKKTGKGYWETGELPDIDFTKDQFFLLLDQEAYVSLKNPTQQNGNTGTNTQGTGTGEKQPTAVKPIKKQLVQASGVIQGDQNTYNSHSFNVYCDLDTLKRAMKQQFSGRAMPGQPTTKSGKPFPYTVYSKALVRVDDIDHVETVSECIRGMGYNVESNVEYLNSMKSQFAIIQAVLGGIGAVSLLVAAIGIANTMMMSIYERTKEIGVIKVLGCGLKNIKQMFLLEAAYIGFIGGVVGNLLSYLMSGVINFVASSMGASMGFAGDISYIPPWLSLLSMAFAVFVGMAAGYLPSLRAMRLSPLAAINN
ncbi:MAG: FtsX-like permease family protein [Lachnospiraceae bacterium]